MYAISDGGEANERSHASNVVHNFLLVAVGAAYKVAEAEEEYAHCHGFIHSKKHHCPNY